MSTKLCTCCNQDKPVEEFGAGYRKKDGTVTLKSHCKQCVRDFSRRHYYKNSEVVRRYDMTSKFDRKSYAATYGRQRLLAFREWINSLKKKPCKDCGGKFHPVVMDLDHVRGEKIKNISGMWSWEREKVLEELEKCDLICSNCHRVRTHERRQSRQQKAV